MARIARRRRLANRLFMSWSIALHPTFAAGDGAIANRCWRSVALIADKGELSVNAPLIMWARGREFPSPDTRDAQRDCAVAAASPLRAAIWPAVTGKKVLPSPSVSLREQSGVQL